jgi:DNA-binding SARP family transcriptional activator
VLIRLLGPTLAETESVRTVELGGPKQRAVLAQLALDPNRAVPVDRIAEGVWGEAVPPRYRQNLQGVHLDPAASARPRRTAAASRIIGHGEAYELVAADDEVDATRFAKGLEAGRAALADGRPAAAVASARGAARSPWSGPAASGRRAWP